MTINEILMNIQTEVKVPKGKTNTFGKYKYRNVEDICEAVKPYLTKYKASLVLNDEIVEIAGRIYVKATATLSTLDKDAESISVSAMAREPIDKKGMDEAQITGSCSSYARKYALGGLLMLDGSEDDPDEIEPTDDKGKSVANEKVDDMKSKILANKCKEDGVDVKKLCATFKIKSLDEITEGMFSNAMNHWEDVKKRCS